MRTTACAAAIVGLAFATLPGSAQSPITVEDPTHTDCAAIFSIIAEEAVASDGAESRRAKSAKALYSNQLTLSVSAGEQPNRNVAAQAIAVRSLFIIDLMETDAGADTVDLATRSCLSQPT